MTEILEGLDGAARRRIEALRRHRRYFWVDVSLRATSAAELGEALGIPDDAFHVLLGFGDEIPSARKLFATEQLVSSRLPATSNRANMKIVPRIACARSRSTCW